MPPLVSLLVLALALALCSNLDSPSEPLPRRGILGVRHSPTPGISVPEVVPGTSAEETAPKA